MALYPHPPGLVFLKIHHVRCPDPLERKPSRSAGCVQPQLSPEQNHDPLSHPPTGPDPRRRRATMESDKTKGEFNSDAWQEIQAIPVPSLSGNRPRMGLRPQPPRSTGGVRSQVREGGPLALPGGPHLEGHHRPEDKSEVRLPLLFRQALSCRRIPWPLLEPDIAALWDRESNGDLTPGDVLPGVRHGGSAGGADRATGGGGPSRRWSGARGHCAKCNSLAFRHPEVARWWDHERNLGYALGRGRQLQHEALLEVRRGLHPLLGRPLSPAAPARAPDAPSAPTWPYPGPTTSSTWRPTWRGSMTSPPTGLLRTSCLPHPPKRSGGCVPRHPSRTPLAGLPPEPVRQRAGLPLLRRQAPPRSPTPSHPASPRVAAQFDAEANGIGPDQVVAGSNRRYLGGGVPRGRTTCGPPPPPTAPGRDRAARAAPGGSRPSPTPWRPCIPAWPGNWTPNSTAG